jgi:hypothetical protein
MVRIAALTAVVVALCIPGLAQAQTVPAPPSHVPLQKMIGGASRGAIEPHGGNHEYLYITAASLDISDHSEIRAGLNYRFDGF